MFLFPDKKKLFCKRKMEKRKPLPRCRSPYRQKAHGIKDGVVRGIVPPEAGRVYAGIFWRDL